LRLAARAGYSLEREGCGPGVGSMGAVLGLGVCQTLAGSWVGVDGEKAVVSGIELSCALG